MKLRLTCNACACLAILLLAGCSAEEHSDLREWISTQKAMTKPRIQPLQEPSVFTPQVYTAANGMDPFNMLKLTQVLSRESAQNASNMRCCWQSKTGAKKPWKAIRLTVCRWSAACEKMAKIRRCCG